VRVDGKLKPSSWARAFAAIADKIKATAPEKIGFIGGDLSSVEDLFAAKALAESLGVKNIDARQDGAKLDPAKGRASYLFNATVEGIDHADALLIVGSNPRWESPVLNARIRRRWRAGHFPIGVIGEKADLTYAYDYLGAGPETLASVASGANFGEGFGAILAKAERPLILVGQGALARDDGAAILALAAKLGAPKGDWTGFSVLHTAAARVGALDLGFVPAPGGLDARQIAKAGALDVVFLVGADEIAVEPGAFVVYIGSHGDRGAHRADVILPGAAYTEKSGTYVNTEGRVQLADRAAFPPGDAREDWAIFRALSGAIGKPLPFDSLAALREKLYAAFPHFAGIDVLTPADASGLASLAAGELGQGALVSPIIDFYLTNPIARASHVMAECSAVAKGRTQAQAAE
jgi:NADH-quinone oxidoreductase subunit G